MEKKLRTEVPRNSAVSPVSFASDTSSIWERLSCFLFWLDQICIVITSVLTTFEDFK